MFFKRYQKASLKINRELCVNTKMAPNPTTQIIPLGVFLKKDMDRKSKHYRKIDNEK